MIKIGILGDIGSGKSFVSKSFGYPVFNADEEVSELYEKDKKIYNKLKKELPKYFTKFPVSKHEVTNAILDDKKNLNKIIKIVHLGVRKKMKIFLKKNRNKRVLILDIPLFLEKKIYKKKDILIFIESKQSEILKRLKKRKNYNPDLIAKFKNIQLSLEYKKKKSQFIIKNDFKNKTIKKYVNNILNSILR